MAWRWIKLVSSVRFAIKIIDECAHRCARDEVVVFCFVIFFFQLKHNFPISLSGVQQQLLTFNKARKKTFHFIIFFFFFDICKNYQKHVRTTACLIGKSFWSRRATIRRWCTRRCTTMRVRMATLYCTTVPVVVEWLSRRQRRRRRQRRGSRKVSVKRNSLSCNP